MSGVIITEDGTELKIGEVELVSGITIGPPVSGAGGGITSYRRVVGGPQPYLSWCLIVRNAEATLEATLKSLRARTPDAEIVIVDTMSRDSSPEIARRYADVWVEWAGPKGEWDRDMPWFDDAAAARQHAFELASGRWRAWIDADDVLPGPEDVERLLRLNNRWQPETKGARVEKGDGQPATLESVLRHLDERFPDADCVWAPYLYQRDASDIAMVWQDRERIVKWKPGRWKWAEKAHEILVPAEGPPPPRVYFDHLLFLHEKKFSIETTTYAVARHFEVLLKQYDAGEITHRRAQYLGWYARSLAPERELEFIRASHAAACNALDRYRSKGDEGNYWLARGLYHDAIEAYGAATALLPDLPDVWAAVMRAAEEFHDDGRVIVAGERLLACEVGQLESAVTPRQHQLEYAVLLAEAYKRAAAAQVDAGMHEEALNALGRVVQLELGVMNHPAIGPDHTEAQARAMKAENARKAQESAMALDRYLQFLCDNDEPVKALDTLYAAAWMIERHPLMTKWRNRLEIVDHHATDEEAYRAFYDDKTQTGAIFSPEAWLDPETGSLEVVTLQRARWAAAWINEHCPNGRIVDVGCFDGIVGIPLLKMCPGITYVGLDVYVPALEEFGRRAERLGLSGRVELHAMSVDDDDAHAALVKNGKRFDAALWMELVEHVQDPVASMMRVLDLAPVALVTTPWGSFDAGHPPPGGAHGSVRDNRGHLRAYTADTFTVDAGLASARVLELARVPAPATATGDSLHAIVEVDTRDEDARGVNFAVAGALWPWNGSTVRRDGIGASEETIVYLAERLSGERCATVFGPVPEIESCRGVGYYPSLASGHDVLKEDSVIVVSRAPAFGAQLRKLGHEQDQILWLQDAYYPDLNPEVAAGYRAIVVVSEWHKVAMHERHGVPLELMHVIPNFVLPEHFSFTFADKLSRWGIPYGAVDDGLVLPQRKNDHFIYASSPDRGVVRLLEVWPKIRATLPNATLDIFYGWKGAARLSVSGQYGWQQRYESLRRRFEELRHQPGVAFRGMVNHERIAREYQRAGVWLYPTKFEETCCTAAIKARVGGAVPVCPPLAALEETAAGDTTAWLRDVDDDEEIVEQCLYAAGVSEDERRAESARALKEYSVDGQTMDRWKALLK